MHSYREIFQSREMLKSGRSKGYVVVLEYNDEAYRIIREFETEDEAAAYTSYLNGGLDPRLTRVQLNPRRT